MANGIQLTIRMRSTPTITATAKGYYMLIVITRIDLSFADSYWAAIRQYHAVAGSINNFPFLYVTVCLKLSKQCDCLRLRTGFIQHTGF